jgi:hypothetical protein
MLSVVSFGRGMTFRALLTGPAMILLGVSQHGNKKQGVYNRRKRALGILAFFNTFCLCLTTYPSRAHKQWPLTVSQSMTSGFSCAKRNTQQTAGRLIVTRISLITTTKRETRQTLGHSMRARTSLTLTTTREESLNNSIERMWLGNRNLAPASRPNEGTSSGLMV